MADRWEQFKRAKDFADAWAMGGLRVLGEAAKAPIEASERIKRNYIPGSGEFSDADVQDAIIAGPGALLPGFGRAAGGVGSEVGIAGGKILKRADAQKMIREMHTDGKTDGEIAWALNERFAPIIDEGTGITRAQAMHTRNRMAPEGEGEVAKPRSAWTPEMQRRLKALAEEFPQGSPQRSAKIAENFREHFPEYQGTDSTIQTMVSRSKYWGGVNERTGAGETSAVPKPSGDFELGAMGGRGRSTPYVSVDEVQEMTRGLGLETTAKQTGGGTTYVKVRDPEGQIKPLEVRIPHPDSLHGGPVRPWRVDTSIEGTSNPHANQMNVAGESYDNPAVLKDRLAYSFGRLPPEPAPAAVLPEGGPINDPRQLKLLSGGVPAPQLGGDPGRFANPSIAPPQEDRLLSDTRALRQGVSDAASDAEAELNVTTIPKSKRSIWDQFERAQ